MSGPTGELQDLIQRAKQGDNRAVGELYELHAQQIYRYVVYRVPDHDAEDITASVFVKMVEGLPDYQFTGAPFEAWLYRIAAARVADYHRRRSRRPQQELTENIAIQETLPEQQLIQDQEQEELRSKMFESLNDEQQEILYLRFVERRTHEDVAAITGRTVSAVKSIQHRALKRLAELMGQDDKQRHYLRGKHD